MRSVGIFEVKTKLSELLRLGEPIEITSHRERVAVIYPKHTPVDSEQVKRDVKALNKADKQDDATELGDYLGPCIKRGDIALCADGKGDYTSKPRPVVIKQNTDYIEGMENITCPITSVLSAASVRVRLKANDTTDLKETSEVETDKITTIRITRLNKKIGEVAEKELNKINYALRTWLDL